MFSYPVQVPGSRARTLEELRALVAAIEGGPRVQRQSLPTGHPALDRATGGWPRPGLVEIVGRPGSGRCALVRPVLADLTQQRQCVAVIDPFGEWHPPGWTGLCLDRVLVAQPSPEQAGWTAEQLARSGVFTLVLLFGRLRLGRSAARLLRGVEQGRCALIVLAEKREQSLSPHLRLETRGFHPDGLRVYLARHRGGCDGLTLRLPVVPSTDP